MDSQQAEVVFTVKNWWEEKWFEDWVKIARREYMKGRKCPIFCYDEIMLSKEELNF